MAEEKALLPAKRRPARLVRRVETSSRAPFLPFGLAPLGALALLVLFGVTFFSRSIEDTVARTAQRALDAAGATWVITRVSGQWVTLEGAPPSREAAARALAAVREAKAGTLLGRASPVSRVSERFIWVGDLAEPAPTPAAALSAPDQAASSPTPASQVDIILPPASAEACSQSLSVLLDTAKIEFAPSSAVIDPSNGDLLDSIAGAASVCAGAVHIEGHTDSSGSAALNRDLSLRRAQAVRAALIRRGLPAGRLFVEGFGDSKPIASNAAAEGRERNRRIEIRMAPEPN